MPLEKHMIFALKDLFVNYLNLGISQEKETSSIEDTTFITVNFVANVDNNAFPLYLGYTNECMMKIYNAMIEKGDKADELEHEDFKQFAIEVTVMILNKLARYAAQKDKRYIHLSAPVLCLHVKNTKFDTQRYFKIGGEYLFVKY